MLTKLVLFALVGIIGDILLNISSRLYPGNQELSSLRSYWGELGNGVGALSAGLTTLVAGILVLILGGLLKIESLEGVVLLAFFFGMVGDFLLSRSGIFGSSLDDWYATVGSFKSAVYGGFAIALTVFIGTVVERFLDSS